MQKTLFILTLALLATSTFATKYWTVTSSVNKSNITEIDPSTGAWKTICTLTNEEYALSPLYADKQSNLFVTYDKNTQQLIYFQIAASTSTNSCDQVLAPVKQVNLPSTLTSNSAVILDIFRETSDSLLVASKYTNSGQYVFTLSRWTLSSSKVTQLVYINTQQSTSTHDAIGPLGYDAKNNVVYHIQYRGLDTVNFPAVIIYSFDVSNNSTIVVDVPLLINWKGGRLMSSIVWNAASQKVIGLWNIGTQADARIISIDPKSGNFGEKFRSSGLGSCHDFEQYMIGLTDQVVLNCWDSAMYNQFYSYFSLKQLKFTNYPQFYLGNEVAPDYLVPIN